MKKLFLYLFPIVCLSTGVAMSQTTALLVDFGSSGVKAMSPDANGRYWNNVTDAAPSGLDNLISDAGQPLGISLTVTGYEGVNGNGTTVPNASTLGTLANTNACSDLFYVSGNNVITVTLGNIPADAALKLILFGSRDIEESRITRYDVAGLTTASRTLTTSGIGLGLSPQPNANRSSIATLENINASQNRSITIQVRRDSNSYGYLGALRLEFLNAVNFSPLAYEIAAIGSPRVGTLVKCQYSYSDKESDAEATPTYSWERSTVAGGVGTVVTDPAAPLGSYRIKASDLGYYYRCGVIPAASTGNAIGLKSYSPWYGPVRALSSLATYHIGNSYTRWTNIPQQLSTLSGQELRQSFPGFQLTDGQSLNFHWDTGLRGLYPPAYGTRSRDELATGSWDVLILQPQSQEWSSWPQGLTEYARRFYQLADAAGTQVYLYAYWPWQSQTISTQSSINTVFEQVRSSISQTGTKPALIIPAGQALRACIEASGTGVLAGYTRESFYMDERHPSALGGYVSALTHYATIYKKSPVGLPATTLSSDAGNVTVSLSPAVAERIQQIVWDVVRSYPYSGLGATSFSLPPIIPPILVESDPPFVVESTVPSDPLLLAYAFGIVAGQQPIQDRLPRTLPVSPTGNLAIEYKVNPTAEGQGVTYTPQWSYDLRRWTVTQPTGTVVARANDQIQISWPKTSRWRFMRVSLYRPAP